MSAALRMGAWLALAAVALAGFRETLEAYHADPKVEAAAAFVRGAPELRRALGGDVEVGRFPLGATAAGEGDVVLRVRGPAGGARVVVELEERRGWRVVAGRWDGGALGAGDLDAEDADALREAQGLSRWAHALFQNGDVAGALATLDAAVEADPDYWWNHFWRGRVLLEMGDLPGALAAHQTARPLLPAGEHAALYWHARTLYFMRQPSGAFPLLEEAIARAPDRGSYYRMRALVRESMGDAVGGDVDNRAACDLGWDEACEALAWRAR